MTPYNARDSALSEDPTPAKRLKKNPKISKHYHDNDADVTLISQEEVHFKVHSYILRANSDVFCHMLGSDLIPTPIDIDADQKDLTLLLDYMHKASVETKLWAERILRLLNLCEKYEFSIVSARIHERV
ncbi:hypothetical protein IAU60_001858 [Kwoniella sp. DSM 27419]